MIRKSEGIVLKSRKFRESSLISDIYTREYGKKSFLVRGARSARSRKKHSFFQPMSIVEIVFYNKDSRDLQLITETNNKYFLKELQTNPVKISLGVLVVDIFYNAVWEEEKNEEKFEFLKSILIELDTQPSRLIHIFLYFLVHLTRHLGFLPRIGVENPAASLYLDLENGMISNLAVGDRVGKLVLDLLGTDLSGCRTLDFGNADKRQLIHAFLRYYQYQLEGFRMPASLEVIEEIFS